ncbi:MAG: hypothetical protein Q9212_002441 [Teloschistes hypoglaucus]
MNFYDGVEIGWTSFAIAITAAFCLILPADSTSSYALLLVAVVTVILLVVRRICGTRITDVGYAITSSTTDTEPALGEDPTLIFRVPYSDDSDSDSEENLARIDLKDQTGRFTGHKASGRDFLALPTELGIQIFQYLQNDKKSFAHLRSVCRHFKDLASPLLFESVHFRRSKEDWVNLYALCASAHLIPHVKCFKLKIGQPPDGKFPLPPLGLQTLKLKSLKVYDYRCLRMGDVRLPIQTQLLTNLYIDTRGAVCDKGEYLRSQAAISTWKPFYSGNNLQNLQTLVITQEPKQRTEFNRGADVIFLLQDCKFKDLRDLRLHFINTRPECLVKFLEACTSDALERVRLYKPVWSERERYDLSLKRLISTLEANSSIYFEATPPWTPGKYTEEEFTFMIENDIVPSQMADYEKIEPGESKVLDRWNEMRTGKNPVTEKRQAQLIASRASVYDPLPDDA